MDVLVGVAAVGLVAIEFDLLESHFGKKSIVVEEVAVDTPVEKLAVGRMLQDQREGLRRRRLCKSVFSPHPMCTHHICHTTVVVRLQY